MNLKLPALKVPVSEGAVLPSGYGAYRRDYSTRLIWACPLPLLFLFRFGQWLYGRWMVFLWNVKPDAREEVFRQGQNAGWLIGADAGYKQCKQRLRRLYEDRARAVRSVHVTSDGHGLVELNKVINVEEEKRERFLNTSSFDQEWRR